MNSNLADSHTASKTRWALLGRLLYIERIPAIPPLLVDGKVFSNFYEKGNIFNNFYISVYSYKNPSTLPSFRYKQIPK